MPDTPAIEFAAAGQPAKINYSVPLPGAHTGRRVMEIDLDLQDSDFTDHAREVGRTLEEELGVEEASDGTLQPDPEAEKQYLRKRLPRHFRRPYGRRRATTGGDSGARPDDDRSANSEDVPRVRISRGRRAKVPVSTWGGGVSTVEVPLDASPHPRLFLVERYGISSFLGDYGMGRTVKTFTLLPGESTTISLKTWQTTTESRNESSSIIDSHEQAARDRFSDTVQNETTDKSTKAKTEEWHVEAEVSASWGVGSAKVSGGGSGEYSSGREEFSKKVGESVQEHAAESSSKREMSVTSSSERTEESGSETLIERTIKNVNVRRVLNFVFRELNQVYTTKVHLKEVRVAFCNNLSDSWEEVSISGLRPFLTKYVQPGKVDITAKRILKAAGIVFDATDAPVFTLERFQITSNGDDAQVTNATLGSDGEFPVPTENTFYRFKRGPLNQEGVSNPVAGVLLSSADITMRTDSVLVEALLGQADALDEYAMEVQKATATAKTLVNEREELIHSTTVNIADPEDRAEALANLIDASGHESKEEV